jgi:hypothetical protein
LSYWGDSDNGLCDWIVGKRARVMLTAPWGALMLIEVATAHAGYEWSVIERVEPGPKKGDD